MPFKISQWNLESENENLDQILYTPIKNRKNWADINGCAAPMKPNSCINNEARKLEFIVERRELLKQDSFKSPEACKLAERV